MRLSRYYVSCTGRLCYTESPTHYEYNEYNQSVRIIYRSPRVFFVSGVKLFEKKYVVFSLVEV